MINSSSEKFVKKGRLFASLFSCEEYAERRCNASSQLFLVRIKNTGAVLFRASFFLRRDENTEAVFLCVSFFLLSVALERLTQVFSCEDVKICYNI